MFVLLEKPKLKKGISEKIFECKRDGLVIRGTEYRLPNGKIVKFLDDNATYLGNQLECELGGDRCFGVAANMDFILVSTYEEDGENPELVTYKKR